MGKEHKLHGAWGDRDLRLGPQESPQNLRDPFLAHTTSAVYFWIQIKPGESQAQQVKTKMPVVFLGERTAFLHSPGDAAVPKGYGFACTASGVVMGL